MKTPSLRFLLVALALAGSTAHGQRNDTLRGAALRDAAVSRNLVQIPRDRLDILRAATAVDVVGADNVSRRVAVDEQLALAPGEFIALKTARGLQISTSPDGLSTGVLPIDLLMRDANGALEQLSIKYETAGLDWQGGDGVFAGDLLLGVVAAAAPNESAPLTGTVQMQLIAPSGAASRQTIPIGRKGIPLEPVHFRMNDPPEPFTVKVLASFDVDGTEIAIPVRRPRLAVAVTPHSIAGYGIEEATVTITSSAGAARRTVTVTATQGSVRGSPVTFNDAGIAVATIRSAGTGTATITASSEAFATGTADLPFTPPYAFLASVGLGTVLGATVSTALSGARKRKRSRLAIDWLIGAIAGIGLTVAVFARIDLSRYLPLPEELGGEITAVAVAFLAALLGVTISKRLLKDAKG